MRPSKGISSRREFRHWVIAIGIPLALLCSAPSAQAQKDALQEGDIALDLSDGWAATEAQFVARCQPGQHLAGFDIRRGDGVLGLQPICVIALAPALAGPHQVYPKMIGGMGRPDRDAPPREEGFAERSRDHSPLREGHFRLACPKDSPVVTQLRIEVEQEIGLGLEAWGVGPSVNGIGLYCGLVDRPQGRHVSAGAWRGPRRATGWKALDPKAYGAGASGSTCPDRLVAVGISGRSNERVNSLGLICGEPRLTPGETVRALGRIKLPAGTVADRRPLSICDAARGARARNSPAAPGLEARCKVEGEQAPIDFDGLAIKGEAIAGQDPLSLELRNQQPEGPARLGFDIGMAVAEGQTAPGPGKQAIQNRLSPAEQGGFVFALAFSLDRNRNAELARIGAAVAAADPDTAAARAAQPDVLHRLGFDIATGLFGNPALGAKGNTSMGPGSEKIRNALTASALNGFDDAVRFHRSRSYLPARD